MFSLASESDAEHSWEERRLEKGDEDEHAQRGGSLRKDHGEESDQKGAKCEDADRDARGDTKITEARCEETAKRKRSIADRHGP